MIKKRVLLVLVISNRIKQPKTKIKLAKKKNYHFTQPIMLMECGIEFLFFPDRRFDFNTNSNQSHYYYGSNFKRSYVNTILRDTN
ncbi:MAG: hypothetical protein P8K68_07135 [Algibacter sp.]|uniref:hypothetical protein n=1 Tax=Algibacter sp. TaxID=1872428 RepID=UPI002639381C|nr:hypothetical protein [Algibacter sp.]MDG1728609.1 hypothetical protein [Algibacter sp.]MDG2178549.1 hypothetical protein [Algibacter sp.]